MTYFCEERRLGKWWPVLYDHDPRTAARSSKDYTERRNVREVAGGVALNEVAAVVLKGETA